MAPKAPPPMAMAKALAGPPLQVNLANLPQEDRTLIRDYNALSTRHHARGHGELFETALSASLRAPARVNRDAPGLTQIATSAHSWLKLGDEFAYYEVIQTLGSARGRLVQRRSTYGELPTVVRCWISTESATLVSADYDIFRESQGLFRRPQRQRTV